MGLSSSTSKSSTSPVYGPQLTGAADTISGVYNQQAPKISQYADEIGGLVPGLLNTYKQGDPALNAASGYVTSTLGSDPAHNPFLDQQIQMTDNNVRNQTEGALGLRGQTGGSSYADIISRNLANNEGTMRYNDYNDAMQRKQAAAGMAPDITAGRVISIAPALSAATTAAGLPLGSALQYGAGIGGLLGQYTNTKTTQSPSLGGLLGGVLGAGLSGWAGGGFKGL